MLFISDKIAIQGELGAYSHLAASKLFKKVKGIRHNGHANYKKRESYWLPAMGNLELDIKGVIPFKATLSEIQCAAGHLSLKRIDKLNEIRISRAKKFINAFRNHKTLSFNDCKTLFSFGCEYVFPTKNFNRNILFRELFNKYKIKCATQYYPLYRYPLFKKLGLGNGKCPITDKFFDNMISFPFHVWMKEKDFTYMIHSLKKILTKYVS